MELAIDLALQASPDHPLVISHPEWFRHAPDGTIKHAENPPKKYQDIYPIHFYGDDDAARAELWQEWLEVVRHWIGHGVRIFRVDNPHTKPIAFWAWLIGEVQAEHPEVLFLSEAFTRPKMMQVLAKVGFSQSYTYFTWRESAAELREYLTELTQSEMREYFRGNLFTNTPDINPHHTDHGRPAFVIRSVLAATLSSSYGIYSGWELCEAARARRSGGVPRQREVRDPRSRLGSAGKHQAPGGGAQPAATRAPRPPAVRQPALRERDRRPHALLPQGAARPGRRR